jgi:hypothetical protein
MEQKTREKIDNIEALEKIELGLEKKVKELQVTVNNLEAQTHTEDIKSEQDTKLKNVEEMNKYSAIERGIEVKRIEAEKRIDIAETMEKALKDREIEIERREQRMLALEGAMAELNSQRSNFEIYKTDVMKQLDQARETIAEGKEVFAKIDSEKQMLAGREAKVKEQERYWNDTIGLLEQDKKKHRIEKENFEGLKNDWLRKNKAKTTEVSDGKNG